MLALQCLYFMFFFPYPAATGNNDSDGLVASSPDPLIVFSVPLLRSLVPQSLLSLF